MRSACKILSALLLCLTAQAQQKTNPHTQINWPANCNNPKMAYNWQTNTCAVLGPVGNSGEVQVNQGGAWYSLPGFSYNFATNTLTTPNISVPGTSGITIPPAQVTWPGSCASGVYSPATNTCVPPGTAANPAPPTGSGQMNAGGIFQAIPGFISDPTLGWMTAGGATYAKGNQTGSGANGIVNATANGRTVVADPSYVITTTANMTQGSAIFTVTNPVGIVAGQQVSGNLMAGTGTVSSVVGNTVTLNGSVALTTNAAATVSFYEMPYRLANYNIPAASLFHLDDEMLGINTDLKRDPRSNPFANGAEDFNTRGCFLTRHQAWIAAGGTGGAQISSICLHIVSWFPAPAPNYGTTSPGHGPSNWGITNAFSLNNVVSSKGIGSLMTGSHAKAGIGDGPLIYFYYVDYGGSVAGADEGQGGIFTGGGEGVGTTTGTVSSGGGGTGATSLSINCSTDCSANSNNLYGGPGQGRYFIDLSHPLNFNMTATTGFSGNIPGTISTDTTVPVSTFWGTLSGDIQTPPALSASGKPFAEQNPATMQTFTVASGTFNSVANTGSPQVGDLICFSGSYHEQAKISSVSGSGPWTVQAPLRMPHLSASWVFANGTCGDFVDFTANDVTPPGSGFPAQTLHFPFDIIGAVNANTLVYQWFSNLLQSVGFPLGNMYFPTSAATATNVGGIVSFTGGPNAVNTPQYIGQSVITISGATNPLYNGTCANVVANSAGSLSCYQSSSIGQASTGGSIFLSIGTSGFGNTAGVLWQGAETLDILDYSETNCAATLSKHAPCYDNKNMVLEPNNAAWANGDSVEQSHHYSSQIKAQKNGFQLFNPYTQAGTNGFNYSVVGPGINGTGGWAEAQFVNLNNGNLYQGHGGGLLPPGGIQLGLPGTGGATSVGYNYGLNLPVAPEPNGIGRGLWIGCPANPWGCNDPTFNYKIFENAGRIQGNYFLYNAYNSDILIGNPNNPVTWNALNNDINFLQFRDNIKFAPMATPAIISTSTSTSNGTIPDATTRYYKITAISRAGSSLQSAEASRITGSSGSNANTITVFWGHVSGATSYQVCESTTAGGELLLATVNGVDNTSFVDGGASASGSCLNVATAPGVQLTSQGTAFTDTLQAASGNAGNLTHTLPAVGGNLPVSIAIGTVAMPITAVAAGACSGVGTITVTSGAQANVLITDSIKWSWQAAPGTVVGNLIVNPFVTNGGLGFIYCNPGAASATPVTATLSWQVTR